MLIPDMIHRIDIVSFISHILLPHIFLRFFDEVKMMIDIGVDIRHTLAAIIRPARDTDLYTVADERATAVTLEIHTDNFCQLLF